MNKEKLWHNLSWQDVVSSLESDVEKGLSREEAARRLRVYGPNLLQKSKPTHPLWLFIRQFKDFMIYILMAAALVSAALLQEYIDAAIIMAIVVANAILGFVQEYRAEKSLLALKELSAPTVRVKRDGRVEMIPSRDLVPGDILLIEEGDKISADARLISVFSLRMMEASLTGESEASSKIVSPITEESVPPGDQVNMVFAGTYVEKGRGEAVVVETGRGTEMGKIASLLEEAEEEETPLQKELKITGKRIAILCLGICAFIFLLGLAKGEEWTSLFLFSVSLAVAAIPEGLPAIVTIALALGVRRMSEENAILRHLPAVETLGCTNVICTDKTGTLTRSEMEAREIWLVNEGKVDLTDEEEREEALSLARGVIIIASLCNNALSQNGEYLGEGTEVALLKMSDLLGFNRERARNGLPLIGEIPFESERKMMSTIHQVRDLQELEEAFSIRDHGYVLFSKGAPEVIGQICDRVIQPGGAAPMTLEMRSLILSQAEDMAKRGLRTMAFAFRPLDSLPPDQEYFNLEKEEIFAGLVGMNDPPRPEVYQALESCRAAHIEVVMITGDHAVTAQAIGEELGILGPEKDIITGRELHEIPEEELASRVRKIGVYARVAPSDKVKIVKAWKREGAVVAMTGDGVNDAPALKQADIGVAMGITGTDVSKEAADMVLADDNFATIVKAVREGRIIYENLKKFIYFLLSCNISEVATMLIAMLFTTQTPLRAVQVLWINLVTDGFPALALGVDTPTPGIMEKPGRDPGENMLSWRKQLMLMWQGCVLALGALACFFIARYWLFAGNFLTVNEASRDKGMSMVQTAVFCTLVFAQLLHAYNCRSEDTSFWKMSLWDNRALPLALGASLLLQVLVVTIPPLMRAFGTSYMNASAWLVIILCSITPVLAIDRIKVLIATRNKRRRKKSLRPKSL